MTPKSAMSVRNTVVLTTLVERRPLALEQGLQVGDGLGQLGRHAARHDDPAGLADLARSTPASRRPARPACRGRSAAARGGLVTHRHLPRLVGQSGGQPWAIHTAAATAANTASDPLTGGPSSASIVTVDGRGLDRPQHPERPDGQVLGPPSSSTAMASLHTQPIAMWAAPDGVGAQHHLVEGVAAAHRHPNRGGPARHRRRRPGPSPWHLRAT